MAGVALSGLTVSRILGFKPFKARPGSLEGVLVRLQFSDGRSTGQGLVDSQPLLQTHQGVVMLTEYAKKNRDFAPYLPPVAAGDGAAEAVGQPPADPWIHLLPRLGAVQCAKCAKYCRPLDPAARPSPRFQRRFAPIVPCGVAQVAAAARGGCAGGGGRHGVGVRLQPRPPLQPVRDPAADARRSDGPAARSAVGAARGARPKRGRGEGAAGAAGRGQLLAARHNRGARAGGARGRPLRRDAEQAAAADAGRGLVHRAGGRRRRLQGGARAPPGGFERRTRASPGR